MSEIKKSINQIVTSPEFITYCDNDLFEFAVAYVNKIFSENLESKYRLSTTQIRGILNISAHILDTSTLYDELKKLSSNRMKKSTNDETKHIWEKLHTLFDRTKDDWIRIIGLDKVTPKQFLEKNLPEGFTNKEKTDFQNLLYAHLMQKFCIHFSAHYIYTKTLKGEKN